MTPPDAEPTTEYKAVTFAEFGEILQRLDNRFRIVATETREEFEAQVEALKAEHERLLDGLPWLDRIWLQIGAERYHQDQKWGRENDSFHTMADWQSLIVERMAHPLPDSEKHYQNEHRLIEIAAMCVAALEARKHG